MNKFSYADKHLQILVAKVLNRRGVDLSQYKESFLRRRLDIRLRAKGLQDYSQYASLLDEDPSEYSIFFETLSINVTEFLRDKDVFDTFYKQIIPKLTEEKQKHEEIRIWSAGCASGEEVYSIAMLLHEALGDYNFAFRVIGTDISPKAIQAAKKARYKSETLRKIPSMFLIKYFESLEDTKHYEVCDKIRTSVTFSVGDLSQSIPPSNLDVILCRNTLMYLESEAQHQIFATFYRSLKKSGYLVLGKAETIIGKPAELFEPLLSKERIYRKRVAT